VLMPTLDVLPFSEEEMSLLSPLLDSKNRLSSNKPFRLSLECEFIYQYLLKRLFRDERFITPVPTQDRFLNPFSRFHNFVAYEKLTVDPESLVELSKKVLSHVFKKVY
jgi:hypothetical protein